MDTFAGLAVYLALTVLTKRPQLWEKFNSGENILFERADFVPPHDTDVWRSIAELGDSEVDRIAGKVKECCAPGWKPDKTLAQTLARKSRWWETAGGTAALPPLPTRSYQSPVASRADSATPRAVPASTSPTPADSRRTPGRWWVNQPGPAAGTPSGGWPTQPPQNTRPAPPPFTSRGRPANSRATATPTRRTSKKLARRRRRPSFVTAGLLFISLGLVAWISLATHQDPGDGALDGMVLILIGFLLTRVRRR